MPDTNVKKNSDLLRLWFEEVWNNDNIDMVDSLLAPDVRFQGTLDSIVSPGVDYKEVIHALKSRASYMKVKVTHSLDEGDWAMVRILVSASALDARNVFDFTGQIMVRVENGRFAEFYSNMDYLGMFEGFGQFPADSLPVCLTGEKLIWAD